MKSEEGKISVRRRLVPLTHTHPHTDFAAPRIELSNTFYEDLQKLYELEPYLEVSGVGG